MKVSQNTALKYDFNLDDNRAIKTECSGASSFEWHSLHKSHGDIDDVFRSASLRVGSRGGPTPGLSHDLISSAA